MAEVDPFIVKIPEAFINHPDKEVREYFQYLNRWAMDMWIRSGADTDTISLVDSDTNRKADTLLTAVLDRVSLGYPLTSDTTGFTVDSTVLYADMSES